MEPAPLVAAAYKRFFDLYVAFLPSPTRSMASAIYDEAERWDRVLGRDGCAAVKVRAQAEARITTGVLA